MFLNDVLGALKRRWYVTVVGALVGVVACFASFTFIGPSYVSISRVLLVPPQSSVPQGGNPLLSLNGMTSTVDVVARALTDEASRKRIEAAGSRATFEANTDRTTSGPVLEITSTATNPNDSLNTLEIVTETVPPTLLILQQGLEVREASYITSTVITRDFEPKSLRTTQIRALVGVFALCVMATLLGAAFLDALILRRQNNRAVTLAVIDDEDEDEVLPSDTSLRRRDTTQRHRAG